MKLYHVGQTVRLAIVGLGGRGWGQLHVLLEMQDVEVTSLCDLYDDRIEKAKEYVKKIRGTEPFCTKDYREAIDRSDVDAVIIMSNWEQHIPMAIYAMRCGKRPAIEVGGASSVQECWDMVHTSEATGVPLMFLENCDYGEAEMTLLNMMRQDVFGTIVHCAGAYSHDLRDEVGNGDIIRHYRLQHFLNRNAELYPSHELGPIMNYLKINRGNRMLMLTSMASKACGLHEWLQKNRSDSPLADAHVNEGDVVTTLIRCANGETIQLTHDCTLPRYYSRGGVIRGTKGLWTEEGRSIYLEGITPQQPNDWDHHPESDAPYMEKYKHPLWKEYRDFGVRGNHDGMDYLTLRAFIESVQEQSEPPIDVYDAATMMSITPLTEESISLGSHPVTIPDFSAGRWCTKRVNPARDYFDL